MKIIFNEINDMNSAITLINELINDNGYMTVDRLKKLCFLTETIKDTDSLYGWKDNIEIEVEHSKDHFGCWELILPEPVLLTDTCINIMGHINGMPISRYIAASLLQYSSLKGEKYYASEDELSEIINGILGSILVIQKQEGTEVKNHEN